MPPGGTTGVPVLTVTQGRSRSPRPLASASQSTKPRGGEKKGQIFTGVITDRTITMGSRYASYRGGCVVVLICVICERTTPWTRGTLKPDRSAMSLVGPSRGVERMKTLRRRGTVSNPTHCNTPRGLGYAEIVAPRRHGRVNTALHVWINSSRAFLCVGECRVRVSAMRRFDKPKMDPFSSEATDKYGETRLPLLIGLFHGSKASIFLTAYPTYRHIYRALSL